MASRKVKYDFNPFSKVRLRGDKREQAKEEIKDFVLSSVLSDVGAARSPVTGDAFEALSSEYRSKKQAAGLGGRANLEFTGDMLDALQVTDAPGGGIRITVSADQQGKADGHNDFTNKSKLPRRPFIPDERRSETFSSSIEEGIERILRRYKDGS